MPSPEMKNEFTLYCQIINSLESVGMEGEGVLDYGVLKELAYVIWAGLMGREDTRQKAFSRVRMRLSFAWTASLASGYVVSFLCKPTLYNPSPLRCLYNSEGLVLRGDHNQTC